MKFEFKNRKCLKIVGEVTVVENQKGLVFIMHGLGGFKEQPHMQVLANTFIENGYTVINFDGTNSNGESEGAYENATVQKHYEDLMDVIAWAYSYEWYQEPFLLAGHSLGGYAVARYAEDFPEKVTAVFPYAAFISGEQSMQTHLKKEAEEMKQWKETGWKTRESKSKPGLVMRLPWSHMEERMLHDLRLKANKITASVLMVVGSEDASCTPENQQTFYNLIECKKEIHIVEGAPHTFRTSEHLQQLKEILDSWIKKIS